MLERGRFPGATALASPPIWLKTLGTPCWAKSGNRRLPPDFMASNAAAVANGWTVAA